MSIAPTRRLPAGERRALIERAAATLFARRGYAGTSTAAIAAAAGVTKPILYRHFASKADLYLALLETHRRDLPGFLEPAGPGAGELDGARLTAILETWFAYVRANAHGWLMLFRDTGGGPEIAAARAGVQARAREVLLGFLAQGARPPLPTAEIEPTAELLRSGLAGLALHAIDHPEIADADLVRVARRAVAGALGVDGGP